MKIVKIICAAVCLAALTFHGIGFADEMLTWETCVREAAEHHPDLRSAKEAVLQASSDKDIAVSAMLPQVSSAAAGTRSRTATSKTSNTYSYSLSGTQLIFDGFQTASDVGSAAKTISAQEYAYAVTSSDVRLNLRVAFADLLKAQRLIALTEEISQRRKQNLELVRLRYEAGREHKGSLLTAQADLAQAEFEVTQARRSLTLSQRELTKELGRSALTPIAVNGEFAATEQPGEQPDFENTAEHTPFLRELIARKEAARFDYASAQADFFPKVYLNTSYSDTASNAKWPIQDSAKGWSAGASISLPLFEGGQRFAQASKSRSLWKQAQATETSGRNGVLVTLETTWKEFQDALAYTSVKEKFLEAAEERARIASAQYETGLVSFDDWVIIEDNLVSAKKAYLDAQANMMTTEAYWIQAKGGTLEYDEK